jgi:hypothetical protein
MLLRGHNTYHHVVTINRITRTKENNIKDRHCWADAEQREHALEVLTRSIFSKAVQRYFDRQIGRIQVQKNARESTESGLFSGSSF